MKYKAIITDLDRTLLKDDKTVSEYTINVLHELKRQRIKFFINTERILPTAKVYFNQLDSDAMAFSNGAGIVCKDGNQERFLMDYQKGYDVLQQIVNSFPGIDISVMTPDKMYTNYKALFVEQLSEIMNFPQNPIERIMIKNGGKHVYNFILQNPANVRQYDIRLIEERDIVITDKVANKLYAMKYILKYYQLKPEQIIGFGDDSSDIDFLKQCGISVAVGNAKQEIRKVCMYVTLDNENDGVGKWIEKNVLL